MDYSSCRSAFVAALGSKKSERPWSNHVYLVFHTAANYFAHQNRSCIKIFHGRPAYNFLVMLLGATLEGKGLIRTIFLPRDLYE